MIPEWAAALEASTLGAWMRGSSWGYPVVNVAHVAGLVLLVGSMMLLDLRILGAGRRAIKLSAASGVLTPFAGAGLTLLIVSGLLLFAADAAPLLQNPLFLPKILLIALGVANALVFRARWGHMTDQALAPSGARIQAALSLAVWVAAATLGRLLAYV